MKQGGYLNVPRQRITGHFSFAILSIVITLSTTLAQSGPIVPRLPNPTNGIPQIGTEAVLNSGTDVSPAGLRTIRSADSSINTRLRIAWGGGKPIQWAGTIEVSPGHFQHLVNHGVEIDPSSVLSSNQPREGISTLHNQISVSQNSAQQYDALDVSLTTSRQAHLKINLVSIDDPNITFQVDRPIEQFLFKSLNM